MGCDYYAASLHKWLGCPLGTGILFVRRDKIPALWPMYGDWQIWTNAVDSDPAGVHGVRLTPHVFVLPGELDKLVEAIRVIAGR